MLTFGDSIPDGTEEKVFRKKGDRVSVENKNPSDISIGKLDDHNELFNNLEDIRAERALEQQENTAEIKVQVEQGQVDHVVETIEKKENAKEFKIMSPRMLKKPIQNIDLEASNNLHQASAPAHPPNKVPLESKNTSAQSSNVVVRQSGGFWQTNTSGSSYGGNPFRDQQQQLVSQQSRLLILQIGLLMECLSSLLLLDNELDRNRISKMLSLFSYSGAIVLTLILAKIDVALKQSLLNLTSLVLTYLMLIVFTEFRLISILNTINEEHSVNLNISYSLKMLFAGVFLTWLISEITRGPSSFKKRLLFGAFAITYVSVRLCISYSSTSSAFLYELISMNSTFVIVGILFCSQNKLRMCLQKKILIGRQKNFSNFQQTQMVSPQFGGVMEMTGGDDQARRSSMGASGQGPFFQSKNSQNQQQSQQKQSQQQQQAVFGNLNSKPNNQKNEQSHQPNSNIIQSNYGLSPKTYQDSLAFISPRDDIDSKRTMDLESGRQGMQNPKESVKSSGKKSNIELKDMDLDKENNNLPPNSRRQDSPPALIAQSTQGTTQTQFDNKVTDFNHGTDTFDPMLRNSQGEKKAHEHEEEEEEDEVGGDDMFLGNEASSQNVSLFGGNERSDNNLSSKRQLSGKKLQQQQQQLLLQQQQQSIAEENHLRMEMQDIILSSLSEGIVVIQRDTSEVMYANRQACHLLNCSLETILPTLLQLRNIYAFKDEVLNFTEILQQFEKPISLSELSTLRGLFINLENRREVMLCVLNNPGNQANSNTGSSNTNNQADEKPKAAPSATPSTSGISIKNFMDNNTFLEIELDQIRDSQGEKHVMFCIRSSSWNNPISVIHSTTLKVQYFIRKMISELSIDMNDIREYFTNMRSSNVPKIDFNGCLGKIDCMTEFLQDFATSSLLISGTFIPIKSQMNLLNLVNAVVDKIRARTTSNQYVFSVHYENICPNLIYSDVKRLDRVFYNLLLYFIDTNETASIKIKVSGLAHASTRDKKKIKVIISCHKKDEDTVKAIEEATPGTADGSDATADTAGVDKKPAGIVKKKKEEGVQFSLSQKKANITNVYMLENMHYGVLLSNSIIQKLEPTDFGIFFQSGSYVSFSFKLSL